jgi:uncharacterized membrane protein YtjA (UPF0391 family)
MNVKTTNANHGGGNTMGGILWTIISILFVLWLVGLVANIGGGLIHLLLVVAVVLFLVNMFTGRRTMA